MGGNGALHRSNHRPTLTRASCMTLRPSWNNKLRTDTVFAFAGVTVMLPHRCRRTACHRYPPQKAWRHAGLNEQPAVFQPPLVAACSRSTQQSPVPLTMLTGGVPMSMAAHRLRAMEHVSARPNKARPSCSCSFAAGVSHADQAAVHHPLRAPAVPGLRWIRPGGLPPAQLRAGLPHAGRAGSGAQDPQPESEVAGAGRADLAAAGVPPGWGSGWVDARNAPCDTLWASVCVTSGLCEYLFCDVRVV